MKKRKTAITSLTSKLPPPKKLVKKTSDKKKDAPDFGKAESLFKQVVYDIKKSISQPKTETL